MSQDDLAADAEMDRTYPSLLERGLRAPTLYVLLRVTHAMGYRWANWFSASTQSRNRKVSCLGCSTRRITTGIR